MALPTMLKWERSLAVLRRIASRLPKISIICTETRSEFNSETSERVSRARAVRWETKAYLTLYVFFSFEQFEDLCTLHGDFNITFNHIVQVGPWQLLSGRYKLLQSCRRKKEGGKGGMPIKQCIVDWMHNTILLLQADDLYILSLTLHGCGRVLQHGFKNCPIELRNRFFFPRSVWLSRLVVAPLFTHFVIYKQQLPLTWVFLCTILPCKCCHPRCSVNRTRYNGIVIRPETFAIEI